MGCYFGPCHILSVVLIAILSILLILSVVSTFVFKSRAKMRVSALTKRFSSVSSPTNLSKSSCRLLVKFSKKSKTPSVEYLYGSFWRYVWRQRLYFRLLFVLIQKGCCLTPLKYPSSRFLVDFRVFFNSKMANFELSVYCVSILKYIRTLLKVSKSEI